MDRTCEHGCKPETCPPDGRYYVSCQDAGQFWIMAGPYQTHADALAHVDKALNIANEIDGRAWFMSWGTCHMKDDYTKPGKLNQLGLI